MRHQGKYQHRNRRTDFPRSWSEILLGDRDIQTIRRAVVLFGSRCSSRWLAEIEGLVAQYVSSHWDCSKISLPDRPHANASRSAKRSLNSRPVIENFLQAGTNVVTKKQSQISIHSGTALMVSSLELRQLKSTGSNYWLPAIKAACICELLLGFFEKCAQRSAQYQKLYFDCDSRL